MSIALGGMGWVTPLGSGLVEVARLVAEGTQPATASVSSPLNGRTFPAFLVPPDVAKQAPAHPRLRRSSAISRYAAVAGLAALEDAGVKIDSGSAERTALIFAIANGGVVYTKRFYHEVVASGAQAASPLLFPETVFNAPASHLAAILGLTGATYTLVGDGAVGLLAVKMAEDLLASDALDRCLVVGAEEADWLLCDAYRRWRLLRLAPPVEPFATPARGTILSEGAGAVLLTREGPVRLGQVEAGGNFSRQAEAAACMENVFARLQANDRDLVVASANGTFIDAAEHSAIQRHCPGATVLAPKRSLGESPGSGALWQLIAGALALRRGEARRALISTCGMNQQTAGLTLQVAD